MKNIKEYIKESFKISQNKTTVDLDNLNDEKFMMCWDEEENRKGKYGHMENICLKFIEKIDNDNYGGFIAIRMPLMDLMYKNVFDSFDWKNDFFINESLEEIMKGWRRCNKIAVGHGHIEMRYLYEDTIYIYGLTKAGFDLINNNHNFYKECLKKLYNDKTGKYIISINRE